MARIAGVNLPPNKRIMVALTYIYGIGSPTSVKILKQAQIAPDIRTKDLTEPEIERLRELIEKNYKVEGRLKTEVTFNIKRLKDIGTWRGQRHIKNLPTRGQRTRSNARTKKGRKVTMATARKVVSEKT